MTQTEIAWVSFNRSNIRRLVGTQALSLLAVRRDGRGYFGEVNRITDEYVELVNGDNLQNLYFTNGPMLFAVIDLPPAPTYRLAAQRSMDLKD